MLLPLLQNNLMTGTAVVNAPRRRFKARMRLFRFIARAL